MSFHTRVPACTPLVEDPRFGFTFSPASADEARLPLVIVAHGSNRDVAGMVAAMREGLGDRDVSILAPLFPSTIDGEDHSDGYKFLISNGIDYIALTRAMIRAVDAPGGRFGPVYLYGFSGGAQFAERYALFEAGMLSGLVVASPGGVTLLDESVEWWPGLAGAGAAIGLEPDVAALREVPVAIIVGSEDGTSGLVARPPGSPHGSIHEGRAGDSRLARARSLHENFRNSGIATSLHELEGVAHELEPVTLKAAELIAQWIDASDKP